MPLWTKPAACLVFINYLVIQVQLTDILFLNIILYTSAVSIKITYLLSLELTGLNDLAGVFRSGAYLQKACDVWRVWQRQGLQHPCQICLILNLL